MSEQSFPRRKTSVLLLFGGEGVYRTCLRRQLTGKSAVFVATIQAAGAERLFVVAAFPSRRCGGVMATGTQII